MGGVRIEYPLDRRPGCGYRHERLLDRWLWIERLLRVRWGVGRHRWRRLRRHRRRVAGLEPDEQRRFQRRGRVRHPRRRVQLEHLERAAGRWPTGLPDPWGGWR